MSSYEVNKAIKILANLHTEVNDPHQPHCGVGALFNGDLHKVYPWFAPRGDWLVKSCYNIVYAPVAESNEAGSLGANDG